MLRNEKPVPPWVHSVAGGAGGAAAAIVTNPLEVSLPPNLT